MSLDPNWREKGKITVISGTVVGGQNFYVRDPVITRTYNVSGGTKALTVIPDESQSRDVYVERVDDRTTYRSGSEPTSTIVAQAEGELFTTKPPASTEPTPEQQYYIAVQDPQLRQSRMLSDFEAQAFVARSGGVSGKDGQEYFVRMQDERPVPLRSLSATLQNDGREMTMSSTTAGVFLAEQKKRDEWAAKEAKAAIDPNYRDTFKVERREKVRQEIMSKPPAYGSLDKEAGVAMNVLGVTSKGFEVAGKGAQGLIQDAKMDVQTFYDKNPGVEVFVRTSPMVPEPKAVLSLSEGVVEGGVTKVGTDRTTAAIVGGANIVGIGVGAVKAFLPAKAAVQTVPTKAQVLRAATVKGVKTGVVSGVVGLAAVDVAMSDDPVARVGQYAGTAVAIGTAYNLGKGIGAGAAGQAKTTVATLKASSISKKAQGRSLTVREARDIEKISREVSLDIKGRPIEEASIRVAQQVKGGSARTITQSTIKTGDLQSIPPGALKAGAYKVDYQYGAVRTTQTPVKTNVGVSSSREVALSTPAKSARVSISGEGTTVMSKNRFDLLFGSKNIRMKQVATTAEPSIAVGQVKAQVSVFTPKSSASVSGAASSAKPKVLRITEGQVRLDYSPKIPSAYKDPIMLSGRFKEELVFESGKKLTRLFGYDSYSQMMAKYGTDKNPVFVIESLKTTGKTPAAIKAVREAAKATGLTKPLSATTVVKKAEPRPGYKFVEVDRGDGTVQILEVKTEPATPKVKLKVEQETKQDTKTGLEAAKQATKASTKSDQVFVVDSASKSKVLSTQKSEQGVSAASAKKVGSTAKLVPLSRSTVSIKERTASIVDVRSALDSSTASKSLVDTTAKVDVASRIDTSSRANTTQITSNLSRLTTRAQVFNQIIRGRGGTNPPPPPPPPFPRLPGRSQDIERGGYGFQVRRGGQFRTIIPGGLTAQEAVRLGAAKVRSTAAATFRLIKQGMPTTVQTGELKGFYRKGDKYIEEPSQRIKTSGEIQEISMKGLFAQKAKKAKRGVFR